MQDFFITITIAIIFILTFTNLFSLIFATFGGWIKNYRFWKWYNETYGRVDE